MFYVVRAWGIHCRQVLQEYQPNNNLTFTTAYYTVFSTQGVHIVTVIMLTE
jgi:hypothetical protein